MASNATVLNDIDENFLVCSICLDQFKEPKLLPCLHRFCSGCLEKLIRNQGVKLTCPLCKKVVTVPKDGFKIDFYLKSIIEYVQFRKSLESKIMKKCFGCSSVLTATAYCFKCNDFLCQSCRDLHMNNNIAKDHRPHVLELSNVEDSKLSVERLDSLKDTLRCTNHPEKVADVCCKACDNLPICMVCGAFGEHKEHLPKDVTTLAREERKRLADKLEILMKLKKKIYKVPTEISAKGTKLDRNVSKRETEIRQQFKIAERKIKSEISELQSDFNMQKKLLNESLQKYLDESKHDLEETISLLKAQYEKVCAEKREENDAKISKLQRENEGNVKQLQGTMEVLKKNFDDVNQSIRVHQKQNQKTINELKEYYDNVVKRFDNLTITANTILVMKHDWTGIQSIPDILAAIDPLVSDAEIKFPNFETIEAAKDVSLPPVESQQQSAISVEEIPDDSKSLSHIEGFCGPEYSVHSITSCGPIIVLSGKIKMDTFIMAVSTSGVQLMEETFECQDYIPSLVCRSFGSSNKLVTVSKPSKVGIYEIYFGSRIKKDVNDIISVSVSCVAFNPGKNGMIIVGTNGRDLHLFDDMLNYKQTVSLPRDCKCSKDIVFHEGKVLLVCDNIEKKALAVSFQGATSKTLYQFAPPTEFEESDRCYPRSICVDREWLIYILWSSSGGKEREGKVFEVRCFLACYKRYGGRKLWSQKVDADASCIATSVNTQGIETLLLATLNSGRIYKYEVKHD